MFLPLVIFLLCLVCSLALLMTHRVNRAPCLNFPPGPWPNLPVLGSLPYLGSSLPEGFRKLRRRYGDVFSFRLSHRPVVVLNTYELLQEAFTKTDFSDRSQVPTFFHARGGDPSEQCLPGIISSNGQYWLDQRRFALSTLRDLGFGKAGMEDIVMEEVADLLEVIDKEHAGQPLDVQYLFNITGVSALWRVISGERLKLSEPKLLHLVDVLNKLFQEGFKSRNVLMMEFEWLFRVMKTMGISPVANVFKGIFDFVSDDVERHRSTFQPGDDPRDFIDAYLAKTVKEGPGSNFDPKDTCERLNVVRDSPSIDVCLLHIYRNLNLKNVLLDLFVAGSETTSTTLNWAVQERVHAELDSVVGRGRLPRPSDRSGLHLVEAVLLEVQRTGDILPFGVGHCTKGDVTIGGYRVPGGTTIMGNLSEILHDPSEFPDPYAFNPDRFLDSNSGRFSPNPKVVPFGLGKRRCLGETLARTELFCLFAGLMHRFRVETSDPDDELDTTPVVGFTTTPKPYKVKMVQR